MQYTINQVARMVGITPKALRHYEKIGLLIPADRSTANYRLYSDADVSRLQQVLFYRKLEFSLKEIADILSSGEGEQGAIQRQIEFLENTSSRYDVLATLAKSTLPTTEQLRPADAEHKVRTALLVQGMQNDFVSGAIACKCAQRIVPNIASLIEAAETLEIPVIFINDMHIVGVDAELSLWGAHALAGTTGFEVVDELCPRKGNHIIYKRFYSGFLETCLYQLLKELKVQELIIMGLLTNVGISHTIADAYYHGYQICLPNDCTAAMAEDEYLYALKQLQTNFGVEITPAAEKVVQLREREYQLLIK